MRTATPRRLSSSTTDDEPIAGRLTRRVFGGGGLGALLMTGGWLLTSQAGESKRWIDVLFVVGFPMSGALIGWALTVWSRRRSGSANVTLVAAVLAALSCFPFWTFMAVPLGVTAASLGAATVRNGSVGKGRVAQVVGALAVAAMLGVFVYWVGTQFNPGLPV